MNGVYFRFCRAGGGEGGAIAGQDRVTKDAEGMKSPVKDGRGSRSSREERRAGRFLGFGALGVSIELII